MLALNGWEALFQMTVHTPKTDALGASAGQEEYGTMEMYNEVLFSWLAKVKIWTEILKMYGSFTENFIMLK